MYTLKKSTHKKLHVIIMYKSTEMYVVRSIPVGCVLLQHFPHTFRYKDMSRTAIPNSDFNVPSASGILVANQPLTHV